MIITFMYGRIASDIDIQERSGTTIAEFNIAIQNFGKDKGADFFKCKAFNSTADVLGKYFKKGSRIALQATPKQPKSFKNKDGRTIYPNVEFMINRIDFVETKAESELVTKEDSAPKADEFMDISDDPETLGELPFQ